MFGDFLFAAQIDKNIFVIDLHGSKNTYEASQQLEKGLFLASQRGIKYAKVVYGIGEGKLKNAVARYLSNHPLIKSFEETEEGGSCIVIF